VLRRRSRASLRAEAVEQNAILENGVSRKTIAEMRLAANASLHRYPDPAAAGEGCLCIFPVRFAQAEMRARNSRFRTD
jgi:hypothetical protein